MNQVSKRQKHCKTTASVHQHGEALSINESDIENTNCVGFQSARSSNPITIEPKKLRIHEVSNVTTSESDAERVPNLHVQKEKTNVNVGSDNYSEGSGLMSDDDTEPIVSFQDSLAKWALTHSISHKALNDLLRILKPLHPELPLNSRMLLMGAARVAFKMDEFGKLHFYHLDDLHKSKTKASEFGSISERQTERQSIADIRVKNRVKKRKCHTLTIKEEVHVDENLSIDDEVTVETHEDKIVSFHTPSEFTSLSTVERHLDKIVSFPTPEFLSLSTATVETRLDNIISQIPTPQEMPGIGVSQPRVGQDLSESNKVPTKTCVSSIFMENVIRELETIKVQIANNTGIVSKLLVEREPMLSKIDVGNLNLPADSMAEMERVEEFIGESSNQLILVSFLGGLGGRSIGDCTRRILSALLSDNIASKFNWAGHNNKLAFRDYKLKEVIVSAVRSNKAYSQITQCAIEIAIKNWLKHAQTRLSHRKKDGVTRNSSDVMDNCDIDKEVERLFNSIG